MVLAATENGGITAQLVQLVGALCVLAAFVAAQFGTLSTDSRRYLALNLAGSLILAVLAADARQYGFLLLEAVWALVSGASLISRSRPGALDDPTDTR